MLISNPIQLSTEFRDILHHVSSTSDSLLITGKAGTGKSTLLSLLRRTTTRRTVVLAPTGIAALNVKGQTIHSFFKFPPKMVHKKDLKKSKKLSVFKKMETLIIDEISMVRADLLDNIDHMLRLNRGIDKPFGGVQVLFFGDMFQLPPVVSTTFEKQIFESTYDSPYFFSADVMKNFDLPMIELSHVYRQTDRHFINLLDKVRTNDMEVEDLDLFNDHYTQKFSESDTYITLSSINAIADSINKSKLAQLPGRGKIYPARVDGVFSPSQYPTDNVLHLKEGAQVMFVKNDQEKRFVNGTLGKIRRIAEDEVEVSVPQADGSEQHILVSSSDWEIYRYSVDNDNPKRFKTEVIGVFSQLPLRLAWAITIHKSQGQTFDKVKIDLGRGAFAYGQTYVALSRCRTLEGIELSKPLKKQDVFCDPRIVDFYQNKRFFW